MQLMVRVPKCDMMGPTASNKQGCRIEMGSAFAEAARSVRVEGLPMPGAAPGVEALM